MISTVLIIDDSATDRIWLKRILMKTGIVENVCEADDGNSALALFETYVDGTADSPLEFPPQLVFLDVNMPLMGGFEFLEEFEKLRERCSLESTVVLMYTGHECERDRKRAESFRFVSGFAPKMGGTPESLRTLITEAMDRAARA